MDKKKLIYYALSALILLPSCAQDEPAKKELPGDGNRIYFRSYLPSVSLSRAEDLNALSTCQVTCFNPDDFSLIDPDTGMMTPYFSDVCFEDDGTGRFFSKGESECIWPATDSRLHFFAFYPSVGFMKERSGDTFFNLINSSVFSEESPVLDYKLKDFRVAFDITNQVDFVTAYSPGSVSTNGATGLKLDFKHQLARVELTAWGANDKYDFEIAGIRIGNPVVQGDFIFSDLAASSAYPWKNTTGYQAPVEHIFSAEESVILLSKNRQFHDSEDDAASIMGDSGAAMLIPMTTPIEAWEGKADPKTAEPNYTTDKMYFSVLLRVMNSAGEVVYPYPNGRDEMTIIYFAIDTDSRIISDRLYKIDGEYHTTPEKSEFTQYIPKSYEEICEFGWAALPVLAKWDAGKKYTYKLNYSNGIGWHDPDDPEPGEPIIERGGIPFTVSIADWIPAEDYNPDINVPKR